MGVGTERALTNRPLPKRVDRAALHSALCSFRQPVSQKRPKSTAVECEMKPMEQWHPSFIRYVRLTCLVLVLALAVVLVLVSFSLLLLLLVLLLLSWSCHAV